MILHKFIDFYSFDILEKNKTHWLIYCSQLRATYFAWIDKQAMVHITCAHNLIDIDYRDILHLLEENGDIEYALTSLQAFSISTNILSSLQPSTHNAVIIEYFSIKKVPFTPTNLSEQPIELFYSQRMEFYCFMLSSNKVITNICFLINDRTYYYHNSNSGTFTNTIAKEMGYVMCHNPFTYIQYTNSYKCLLTYTTHIPKGALLFSSTLRPEDFTLVINHLLHFDDPNVRANGSVRDNTITIMFSGTSKRDLFNSISLINGKLKEYWQWSSQKPHPTYAQLDEIKTHRLLSIVDSAEDTISTTLKFDPINVKFLLQALDSHFKLRHNDYTFI